MKQVGGCRINNVTLAVGVEVEIEPCFRCSCLPGPIMSCAGDCLKKGTIMISLLTAFLFIYDIMHIEIIPYMS